MVFNFDNNKKNILNKKDKSNKESWDKPIVKLCDKVNSMKDYFTTSSCSGRIVLIIGNERKMPGLFLFRTHEKVSFEVLKEEIEKACEKSKDCGGGGEMISFKQEPCVLTISCRDLESQRKLFDIARNNGWKKSGIVSTDRKFMLELMSTENISFPVINNGKILVDDEFLRIVVGKANDNLIRSWEKINRFEKLI